MAFAKEAAPKSGGAMMELAAVSLNCAGDSRFIAAMQEAASKQMVLR